MKSLFINIILFLVALILFVPVFLINMIIVLCDGHKLSDFFLSTAISLDQYANYEFRTLLNKTMRKNNGHRFGIFAETISYALGKNKAAGTLTDAGKILCAILNFFDKNHVEKTVMSYENE